MGFGRERASSLLRMVKNTKANGEMENNTVREL
jgi:hypothetical protein